jgi:hypothetical protein
MEYKLEKKIWTESDFEQMGWHDCNIYKMGLTHDLVFDIDYILKWNKPDIEGLSFTFWLAPSTLVFKNVKNLHFDIDLGFHDTIEIDDIEKEETENGTNWNVITQQGDFEFISDGYKQFIRQDPFFEFSQTISFTDRHGFSLEETINQDNPNRLRKEFIDSKNKDLENYEIVKKRQLIKQEHIDLSNSIDNNHIELKDYLKKKREINDLIEHYDYLLKETRFENW